MKNANTLANLLTLTAPLLCRKITSAILSQLRSYRSSVSATNQTAHKSYDKLSTDFTQTINIPSIPLTQTSAGTRPANKLAVKLASAPMKTRNVLSGVSIDQSTWAATTKAAVAQLQRWFQGLFEFESVSVNK